MNQKYTFSLLVIFVIWLTACTPTEVPTQTPTSAPEMVRETPAPSSSPTLLAQPTATIPFSLTDSPTPLSPTSTLAPTPLPDITTHNPTAEDIQAYLLSNGFTGFNEIAKVLFADVNGDGETDAVAISDQAPVFVFLWQGDRFAPPAQTGEWRDGVNHADGRYVYLKDYTEDGIPEIINDDWWSRGNEEEEYIAVDWERQITYCEQDGCRVIWQDWFQTYGNAPISTGMFYFSSFDYTYMNNDQLFLERRYSGFTFYWPYIGGEREPVLHPELNAVPLGWDTKGKFYRDVDVIRRYVWNGTEYVFLEDQVLKEPELIAEDMVLEIDDPNGDPIKINFFLDTVLQRVRGDKFNNERCQVFDNNVPISDPFACKYIFTNMHWENIIPGKGQQLVITTVAGDQSYIWPDLLVEKGCFHRRMMVYEWENETFTQVANFVGCIRGPDLFGVQIEDYDLDGQLEITAAPPWPQFVEIDEPDGFSQDYLQINRLVEVYEWDGEKFVIEWALDN